jgi:streptogramin lyase
VDRNDNGSIDTSTGPTDVLPWGEDECMVWNTALGSGSSIGARATAWDGREDEETGEGGSVYIGAVLNHVIYRLNGDTGAIVDQAATTLGHYGGAIDGRGNFWTVAMTCTIGACQIERTSIDNLADHEVYPVHCGYGISIDGLGRVWTAGLGCVSRYDPETGQNPFVATGGIDFNRGVAVGSALSEGFVWAANTNGDLLQIDRESVQVVHREPVGVQEMVGAAVDCEGYVWTVSLGGNSAYKVHPGTWQVDAVPLGQQPYTYSDMTGMQLRAVIPPPR